MTALLQEGITRQTDARPENTAVVLQNQVLTYGRLEQVSNQLAALLKQGGCQKGDRILLLMPKSLEAVISILGILKADCIYVPIDPGSPPARVAKILDSCEGRFLLGAGAVSDLLDRALGEKTSPCPISIGWMGSETVRGENFIPQFCFSDLEGYPDGPISYQNSSDALAYILFTSGSTGVPKGVGIRHSSVLQFNQWAIRYFGMTPSDKISSHPPLHFDLSVFDLFGTLTTGAELHLVPPELNLLPNKLAEFMRTTELTQWFSVPSILSYMTKFDVVNQGDFPVLKRLIWCGEVFTTPSLIYWMKRLPHVTFTNLYGPTEATIASSYYTVPTCPRDDKEPVPIGTACDGEELLVLDSELRPVSRGEIGDLFIRGVGLSPGYWRNPEKTREAFFFNPNSSDPADRIYKTGDLATVGDDGLIYFMGRVDDQIKSRGYRIELGEIEAALTGIDYLRESAIVAVSTEGFEGSVICCAFVPSPGVVVPPSRLRMDLSHALPSYMLPSRWMAMESLPRNTNGKIDRRKLKDQFRAGMAAAS